MAESTGARPAPGRRSGSRRSGFDVGLLDKLMNLVGELVLTRNQILRCSIVRDEAMFQASSQRLNLITTELQEGMMKTRMQPIRNISSKLPRVVRDLALACGKRATIAMVGEETELDKTLGEAIKDPITHIVRNAIDHGIEPPEVRESLGKPAEGTLRLRAYHEGGMVNIELSDDGGGIDPARLRRKAIERGWLTEEQAAQRSDRDILALIFRPGFSTAESLTMVSGRGVGMDVVKSRVESIGGSVDATSRVGVGTTIKMKIPLTLTIINALIVSAGGDRFAIPQVNLVELIRLKGQAARDGLIDLRGTRAGRYRGKVLPLIDLNEVLKVGPGPALGEAGEDAPVNIVVLQADQRRFGLVVDLIDDAQEIVVRPLARQLKGIHCLAGATIMGDGRIALILDVFGLAKGLDGRREAEPASPVGETGLIPASSAERHALLVLRGTDGSPLAIRLDEVDRLENVPRSSVEWVGDRPLVQYRRTLLPLVDAAAWLRGEVWLGDRSTDAEAEPWQVVIHVADGRRVGLVFSRVLDIVEEALDVRGEAKRPGVRLTAAVQGRATEVLDVRTILAGVDPVTTLAAGGAHE
jgi:two-component system chemotaxis sensor kinase CheA